ncbi:hypothetical protein N7490_008802 [Penicillium lividum]|nr:hypothetical protein N7490_008802 [Penicillium lividum]
MCLQTLPTAHHDFTCFRLNDKYPESHDVDSVDAQFLPSRCVPHILMQDHPGSVHAIPRQAVRGAQSAWYAGHHMYPYSPEGSESTCMQALVGKSPDGPKC